MHLVGCLAGEATPGDWRQSLTSGIHPIPSPERYPPHAFPATASVVPPQVAILDGDEQRFLEASMAYSNGKPIMSDEDFDALKNELRVRGSIVSAQVGYWAADAGVLGVCLQQWQQY